MLQAHGARLWQEWNAAISPLLSDYSSLGSSGCDQGRLRHWRKTSGLGFCTCASAGFDCCDDAGFWAFPPGN